MNSLRNGAGRRPDATFRRVAPQEALRGLCGRTTGTAERMTADDFRSELASMFDAAANAGRGMIVVRAGDLHRAVGGYPGPDHRMPMCCNVMYAEMVEGVDEILSAPPKAWAPRWRSSTCCRAPAARNRRTSTKARSA